MALLGMGKYAIFVLGGRTMMDYLRNRVEEFLDYIADALIDFDIEFDDEPFDETTKNEVA
jgi:hypothetical protein